MRNLSIEERAIGLAQYIIDSKDTVGGAAKKVWYFEVYGPYGCNTGLIIR